jgi:small nuclear ribonucleoprotein (snRNP)-like protein
LILYVYLCVIFNFVWVHFGLSGSGYKHNCLFGFSPRVSLRFVCFVCRVRVCVCVSCVVCVGLCVVWGFHFDLSVVRDQKTRPRWDLKDQISSMLMSLACMSCCFVFSLLSLTLCVDGCMLMFCTCVLLLRRAYLDKTISLHLNKGRKVSGTLRGFDQFMNIVLDDAVDETPAPKDNGSHSSNSSNSSNGGNGHGRDNKIGMVVSGSSVGFWVVLHGMVLYLFDSC